MDFEDYLSDLMDHGAEESLTGVDLDAVLRGGEQLGLRLRRRRRNRIATGVAAVVVAVAVGTTTAIERFNDPDRDEMAAAHGTHAAAPAPAVAATPAPTGTRALATVPTLPATPASTPTASAVKLRPITYKDLVATFTQLLPTGFTVALDPTVPLSLQTPKQTSINVDDGHGQVIVILGVSDQSTFGGTVCPAGWTGADEGPRPAGALQADCTPLTLPNGDHLLNVVTGDDGYGYYDIEVTLTRTDGVAVSVTMGNGYLGTKVPVTVTRPRPPLSVAQVDAIVESPQWQITVVAP